MAVGRVDHDGRVTADAPEPVGDPTTLLRRLRGRAAEEAGILVGFDFPIGLPRAYADAAGIDAFTPFLRALAEDPDPAFFDVADVAEEITVHRPFYPGHPAGSRRQHLVDALAVEDFTALLRICERRSDGRAAASPLFWLVGAKQVGRAAISGWRDVVGPALRDGDTGGLWPFDGHLADLLATRDVVLAETYPAEFYGQLGAQPGTGGKGQRSGRAPACRALISAARGMGVDLTEAARVALDDAFGERRDGEDRFDGFVGLLGMLNVVLGRRDAGPPDTLPPDVVAVEGWMLGQGDPRACPTPGPPGPTTAEVRSAAWTPPQKT